MGQRRMLLLLGPVPDDDVIVEPQIEQAIAVGKLPGQAKILPGRGRISGGVIMDEDQGGGPFPEFRTENLSGMHEGGRERPGRREGVHDGAPTSSIARSPL